MRFRNPNNSADESPQELYTRLKDLFCKWVRYPSSTKEDCSGAVPLCPVPRREDLGQGA